MFLGGGLLAQYASPVTVQVPNLSFVEDTSNPPNSVCYAGCRFDSDGGVYRKVFNGAFNYSGSDWLLSGSAASYWLFRTIDSGTLTNDDGDGNQLNTDNLDYWISTTSTRTTKVTFDISDDSSNSNTLATRQYTFTAFLL